MARTLELKAPTGLTLTVEVVERGTNVITETISLTEKTVAKQIYTGTIATAGAGEHELNIKSGSSYIGTDEVVINGTDDTTSRARGVAKPEWPPLNPSETVDLSATTVATVTNSVTVGTNNDKTGYSLSAAAIQAIWDALTSALTTVGSIGKLLVDNINATISSRAPSSTALTNATWTDARAANLDNVDAAVSTRATPAQVNTEVVDVVSTDARVAGVSIEESLRRIGAITSGIVEDAGTGTETFKDYAESANTIVITVDSSGNRSAITYN